MAIFALYADQAGGAPLWVETQNVTCDAQGHYTVVLGAAHTAACPSGYSLAALPDGWPCSRRAVLSCRAWRC